MIVKGFLPFLVFVTHLYLCSDYFLFGMFSFIHFLFLFLLLMSDFYLVFRSVPISPIFEIFGLSTNYYYGIIAISEELTRLSMVLN